MRTRVLCVGVDVSKAKLDVTFVDEEGKQVHGYRRFSNRPQGWEQLVDVIASVARKMGDDVRVLCTMESTSYFHKRVAEALSRNERYPMEVYVANPRSTKSFARVLLKDSKTDRIDSAVLAQYGACMHLRGQAPVPEKFEQLRDATRSRRRYVEERTDYINRLRRLLGYYYPGYEQVVGTRLLPKALLVVLSQYPTPQDIVEAGVERLAKLRSGSHHRVGERRASRFVELAQQAPSRRLARAVALSISQTARRLLELSELLAQMNQAVAELVEQVYPNNVLESIPGIGPVTAGCILAEVVDISRFKSKREFVGYCGLYPTVWQSGQGLRHAHMTYKGNRMLKLSLLFISAVVCQHNAVFDTYYQRLRARGKSRRAALGAVARKLAEVIYVLLSRGERWNEEKAWAGLRKGERMAASTTPAEQPMDEGVSQGATHDSVAVGPDSPAAAPDSAAAEADSAAAEADLPAAAPDSPAAAPDSPAEESSDEEASQDAGAGATPRRVAEPRGAGEGGGGPVAAVLPGKRSRAGDGASGRRPKPLAVAGKRVRPKEGAARRL